MSFSQKSGTFCLEMTILQIVKSQELRIRFGINELGSNRRKVSLQLQVSQDQRKEAMRGWQEESREHHVVSW